MSWDMGWDVMCNERNKSESFYTYVPTYHGPRWDRFFRSWCWGYWGPTLLKIFIRYRWLLRCHRGIEYKKKFQDVGKFKNPTKAACKWRNIKRQVARFRRKVRGVRGCNSHHFKLRIYCGDARQPRLRPSLDGYRRPFPVRLPYVRRLATGPNGTVMVSVWRTRLSV